MHMHSKWSLKVPRACSYTLGRGGQAVGPGYHEKVPQEANPSFPDVPRLSENVGKCWNHLGGGDLRILGLIHISSITDDLAIYFHSSVTYQDQTWNTKYLSIPHTFPLFLLGNILGGVKTYHDEIPNTFPSLLCFPAVFVGELIGVKTPKSDMKYQIMLETSKSTLQHCHPQPYINI